MAADTVNQNVVQHFQKLFSNHRLGHAYLLVGPKQAGKTQTALRIAQLVNCESNANGPCLQCPSCRKIGNGQHPDVSIYQEQDGSIKIDQIRSMLGRLQLKSFEAKTKVFIIREVEHMTIEAANSLLKSLEEPSAHSLMILTTSNWEANLDTIRSRCHVVRFFASSRRKLQDILHEEGFSQLLTVYTDGCVGKAGRLLEDGFIERKNKILDSFLDHANEDMVKKLSAEKDDAKEALQVFLSLVRDAILFKAGLPGDELMHTDRLRDIRVLAQHSTEELSVLYQQTVKTRQLLEENLNVKMAFNILRQRI